MQGRCTKTHQRENFRVEIVELLLRLNTLRKSIAKIAGLPGDALRRYAPFVVKSILEKMVDQNPHKRVHILAAGNYEEETVYRLTVEESHLYYANGVLVTNTDQEDHTYDEAALICMARPMSLDPNDAISAGITSDNEQTAGRLTDAGKAAWEELNKMREELEEDKANEEDAIMDLLDSFGGA